jgi:hypothetical protein
LNRLKGNALLKRGPVPANFGNPIASNKTMKTNIVSGCACSPDNQARLYINPNNYNLNSLTYTFQVGQQVYAIQTGNDFYSIAIVVEVNDNGASYLVRFEDETEEVKQINELRIYYECGVCNEL